jgi:hypothetical protein
VIRKSFNIFKDEIFCAVMLEDSCNIEKQSSPSLVKSPPLSGNGEGLAGEASDKKIVSGNSGSWDIGDRSGVNSMDKVFVIGNRCIFIKVIGIDARMT